MGKMLPLLTVYDMDRRNNACLLLPDDLSPSHNMSQEHTPGQHASAVVNSDHVTNVALILSGREPEVDLVVLLDMLKKVLLSKFSGNECNICETTKRMRPATGKK